MRSLTVRWPRILAVLALLSTALLPWGAAQAANQVLTITPTAANQTIHPGSVTTGSFEVLNQGNGGYNFHVYAAPYSASGEDYTPDFTPLPGKPNVASWFHFSPTQSNVQPGQSVTINYTMTVPQNLLPGGYYAIAFAETQLPKANQGVTLNERVGELFYLTVPGPVEQGGKLLTWQSNWLQQPPFTAAVRLENSGNLHYVSAINVSVRDIFGNPKYTLQTQKVVLPQTIRRVTVTWPQTPSIGLFKVNGTATVLGKTVVLPTKYVLVASPAVRIILLGILIVLILITAMRYGLRTIRRAKKPSA